MTREELWTMAHRHSRELFADDHDVGDLGAGAKILEKHGVDPGDATQLCLELASSAHAADTLPGQAALVLQGLIFGLWLAEEPRF